jgi:hypothetical protein
LLVSRPPRHVFIVLLAPPVHQLLFCFPLFNC